MCLLATRASRRLRLISSLDLVLCERDFPLLPTPVSLFAIGFDYNLFGGKRLEQYVVT